MATEIQEKLGAAENVPAPMAALPESGDFERM